ncbi:HD domain-containing protein [Blastopirellula marina]|uniref:Metal-dependent phosphohydrolase n=1 Tax=Blastopirellula marina TaxID=124 RepID=A0A2S8GGT2_9BACT|nr:HD domain-containing protein [Blastopirellula marina]PQO43244.1 metal-dependent phosphohydrolase [Blastopirellula marina]
MTPYSSESLCSDPIHGYIPFVVDGEPGEVTERDIIDSPWVQRMRQIHQLQTAWWVYPTAEHTRFQHVLGVMHLASRAISQLYPSLQQSCPDVPSRGYVETLMRMAGLLHDVGHGPFGHFFDSHFLSQYGLTHEKLGAQIIQEKLAGMLSQLRRCPEAELDADEQIDPAQIAWLIQRPRDDEAVQYPQWLIHLRSLLSGIYTIDNMDFVLRDAYMTGYSSRSYDLDRLLHYSFFTPKGLTIHHRGMGALIRFMNVRAELFHNVYFHREVMAIDKGLEDLFRDSREYFFPGDPSQDLDRYRQLTEFSLLVDVARWSQSDNPQLQELGRRWDRLLERDIHWKFVCERSIGFNDATAEQSNILRSDRMAEVAIRDGLPESLKSLPLKVAVSRYIFRHETAGLQQNYLYDAAHNEARPLTSDQIFRSLPISRKICRIYAENTDHAKELSSALDALFGGTRIDDLTNM